MRPYTVSNPELQKVMTIDLDHVLAIGELEHDPVDFTIFFRVVFMFRDEPIFFSRDVGLSEDDVKAAMQDMRENVLEPLKKEWANANA